MDGDARGEEGICRAGKRGDGDGWLQRKPFVYSSGDRYGEWKPFLHLALRGAKQGGVGVVLANGERVLRAYGVAPIMEFVLTVGCFFQSELRARGDDAIR